MADQIVVLEDGRVVEQGAPADLRERRGRYAEFLAQRQAAKGWRITAADGARPLMRLCLVLLALALSCASVLIGARQMEWQQLFDVGDAWLTLTASRLPRLAALVLTGVARPSAA